MLDRSLYFLVMLIMICWYKKKPMSNILWQFKKNISGHAIFTSGSTTRSSASTDAMSTEDISYFIFSLSKLVLFMWQKGQEVRVGFIRDGHSSLSILCLHTDAWTMATTPPRLVSAPGPFPWMQMPFCTENFYNTIFPAFADNSNRDWSKSTLWRFDWIRQFLQPVIFCVFLLRHIW